MWGGTGFLGEVGNAIGCSRRSELCEGGCRCSSCLVLATCETPKDSHGAPLGPKVGDGSALGSRCRRWTALSRRPGSSFSHTSASCVERMVGANLARRASRKTFNIPRALAQRFHDPGREMYLRANPKIQGVGRWPKNHPRLRNRRLALHRRARRRPPRVRETCTPLSSRRGGTREAASWSRPIFRGWWSGVAATPSFESTDRRESIGPGSSATE